jgi:RimJ/RimL family protein N-acetyltransferase
VDLHSYSATETLRDGRALEIRALLPSDREALQSAAGRLSDESLFRRFFTLKRHFSEREVEYYTHVDFVNHVALVAVLGAGNEREIVAGVRYVVTEPGVAEIAFTVDDQHQGLGIGGLMMKHIAALARAAGLKRLVAEVLAENAAMLKVFDKSGLPVRSRREHEVMHVTLELA